MLTYIKNLSMKVKVIVGTIMAVFAFSSVIWGTSAKFTEYCEREKQHEAKQAKNLAEVSLEVIDIRMRDIERRMRELERDYGCPNCFGSIRAAYDDYKREYKKLHDRAKAITGG